MTTGEAYQFELRERTARQQKLDAIVRAATDAVARVVASSPPSLHHHTFYGASAIHPRHSVVWFVFRTDADYAQAQAVGLIAHLDALTREKLLQGGYPVESVPEVLVNFTTHETVQRETSGNYWHYFK